MILPPPALLPAEACHAFVHFSGAAAAAAAVRELDGQLVSFALAQRLSSVQFVCAFIVCMSMHMIYVIQRRPVAPFSLIKVPELNPREPVIVQHRSGGGDCGTSASSVGGSGVGGSGGGGRRGGAGEGSQPPSKTLFVGCIVAQATKDTLLRVFGRCGGAAAAGRGPGSGPAGRGAAGRRAGVWCHAAHSMRRAAVRSAHEMGRSYVFATHLPIVYRCTALSLQLWAGVRPGAAALQQSGGRAGACVGGGGGDGGVGGWMGGGGHHKPSS